MWRIWDVKSTKLFLFLINARFLIYLSSPLSPAFAWGSFCGGALNELQHPFCSEMKVFLAGIWVFLVQEIIFFREGKGRERAVLLKSGY